MGCRLLLLAAAVLAGCASPPGPSAPGAPGAPAAPATRAERTQAAEAMAAERQWLDSWFKGTPVAITQAEDGSVTVAVPRAYSFDDGRSRVKPALGAVLDKVAESLRRRPNARLVQVSAPDDGQPPTRLALERAAQVRRHLQDRGVAGARMAEPAGAGAATVQLRIAL
jgi:outer membrane protein OmpA-like peptidoglycan-associated protein